MLPVLQQEANSQQRRGATNMEQLHQNASFNQVLGPWVLRFVSAQSFLLFKLAAAVAAATL